MKRVVVVLALIFSACGGDDKGASTGGNDCAAWVGKVVAEAEWRGGCEIDGVLTVGAVRDCVDGSKLWGIGDEGEGGVWQVGTRPAAATGYAEALNACLG